jgi:hypothetical protein
MDPVATSAPAFASAASCGGLCLSVVAASARAAGVSPRRPRPRVHACAQSPRARGQRDEGASIRWTDRVALQAQVGSAEETLVVLLEALRENWSADVCGALISAVV